jgi:DNA-binding transcriptional ArsR family regulator
MEISLDTTYNALSHPIRRGILEQLRQGSQLVHELAESFEVSAPAISRHLRILEGAQMIQREKRGREQHIYLNGQTLRPAATYLQQYQAHWEQQLDALNTYVKNKEKRNG